MAEVTVAVSCPVSDPAPLPKPRLLVEVMPLLAVPDLRGDHGALGVRIGAHRPGEVLGLSLIDGGLLAQVRELVLELLDAGFLSLEARLGDTVHLGYRGRHGLHHG